MTDPLRPNDESGTQPQDESNSLTGTEGTSTSSPAWATAPDPVSSETSYQPVFTPASPPVSQAPPAFQQPSYQQPTSQQPPYQQPPDQAYQPPAYPQSQGQWVAPQDQSVARPHNHSTLVGLASVFLGFVGLFWTFLGLAVLLLGSLINDLGRGQLTQAQIDAVRGGGVVAGIVLLVIGLPHLIAAIWAPLHKGWARWLGVIVSVLGVLLGVVIATSPTSSTTINGQVVTTNPLGPGLFILVPYAVSLVALIFSRRHFASG